MYAHNSNKRAKVCLLACIPACVLLGASAWAEDRVVPDDFSTIQGAINAALPNDRVQIKPGTYSGNLVLKSNIQLEGTETARTILLSTSGSGSVMEISNLENITISNLTFSGGDIGIEIAGSTDINIRNNVFFLGNGNTAISVDDTDTLSETDIRHNTFHGNNIAIDRDNENTVIKNNIFSSNGTAVTDDDLDDSAISHNCFAPGEIQIGNPPVPGTPMFVDIPRLDFHLQDSSGCKDAGDPADSDDSFSEDGTDDPDAGAYGGPDADTKPFPVGQPDATVDASATPGQFDVTLRWGENLSYLTTGYEIHYGTSSRNYDGEDATDMNGDPTPSPVAVGLDDSYTLFGLLSNAVAPEAPELLSVTPSNQSLDLRWSEVAGATGYRVEYGIAAADENRTDVGGDVTTFEISGLENGTTYRVRVSALRQATYFFALKVLGMDGAGIDKSAFSPERSVRVGSSQLSAPSNERTSIPEEVEPFPTLPDEGEGCFVATAAYGHISHPKVQVLRDFRDRYLLPNPPGRAFVRWYYRHSPAAAAFIARHEVLRAFARWTLLPLIGIAWLMMYANALLCALAAALAALAGVRLRRSLTRTGYQQNLGH